jgi:CheY-like chemotaxis protein
VPQNVIAIVDQDDNCRRDAARMLRSALGLTVVSMADGPRAIALIERLEPGLVLADLAASDGSGASLVGRLKGQPETCSIPLAAMSDGGLEALDSALAAGCDACIAKPFRLGDLVSFVRECLAG